MQEPKPQTVIKKHKNKMLLLGSVRKLPAPPFFIEVAQRRNQNEPLTSTTLAGGWGAGVNDSGGNLASLMGNSED